VDGDGLAQISNNLLYSSMAVYAFALAFFAADLGFGPRSRRTEQPQHTVELAHAGVTSSYTDPPEGAASLQPEPPRGGDRFGRIAVSLTSLAFALHLFSVVARGLSASRAPWGNMFEFSTAGALAVTGVFLVLLHRNEARYLGTFVILPVLLTLGLAVSVLYTESAQLVPALKSVWLVIHVSAAIVASGIFTVGFAQTICYLVQERRERRSAAERSPSFMDRLPSAASLDRQAYRMHAFAFPLWTFAVIAGAIWAENAWGRYWGWDPKEVWAFITWMVYACYLHARATAGWRGRKAAYVALLGYATFLFNYLVVNIFLVGFHSYAGVG
jgi:cytochrome c-type biogenesis protein CcsB